jgi:hypothetical protein
LDIAPAGTIVAVAAVGPEVEITAVGAIVILVAEVTGVVGVVKLFATTTIVDCPTDVVTSPVTSIIVEWPRLIDLPWER